MKVEYNRESIINEYRYKYEGRNKYSCMHRNNNE
jgi:hypothetical protein